MNGKSCQCLASVWKNAKFHQGMNYNETVLTPRMQRLIIMTHNLPHTQTEADIDGGAAMKEAEKGESTLATMWREEEEKARQRGED
jgi:hypothetical protein